MIAKVQIEADGKVSSAQILNKAPILSDFIVTALKQWTFATYLEEGCKFPHFETIRFKFFILQKNAKRKRNNWRILGNPLTVEMTVDLEPLDVARMPLNPK